MLRKIKLYGYLKEKYGDEYLLAVDTPAEAVRALGIQLPGFKDLVRKGEFHVLIGDKKIDETELTITAGTIDTIHFVPIVAIFRISKLKTLCHRTRKSVLFANPDSQ